jgi:S1-C subfamily serine protease
MAFAPSRALFAAERPETTVSVKSDQHGNAKGGAPQSYLGIDVRAIGDDQVATLKLKDTRGAEIIRVDHDAPAGKMGLREHDVVLQMNGVTIETEEQLRRLMHDCPPGKMVVMVIARDGQVLTTSAPMADRVALERQAWVQHVVPAAPPPGPQAPADALPTGETAEAGPPAGPPPNSKYSKSFIGSLLSSPTYTGVIIEVIKPQLAQFFGVATGGGLLVQSVADNSPAAMAGLKAGDVITRANFRPMTNLNAWTKIVHEAKGKPIAIDLIRDKQLRSLTVTPDIKHKSSLELPSQPQPATLTCMLRL